MDKNKKPKVAIIGGGISGTVLLRHLKEIADVNCIEAKDQPLGLWNYSSTTDYSHGVDKDQFYKDNGTVHNSLYEFLVLNTPFQFAQFKDFQYPKDCPLFPNRQEFHQYMEKYIDHFGLRSFYRFSTYVLEVRLLKSLKQEEQELLKIEGVDITKKFLVRTIKSSDLNRERILNESCDYCFVANGHNSVPLNYSLEGKQFFKGSIIHSHSFRRPDEEMFIGKTVAVIGTSYSGMDMMVQLLTNPELGDVKVKKLILSGDTQFAEKTTDYKKFIGEGRLSFKEGKKQRVLSNGKLEFSDGSIEEVDTIVLATGYQYTFPFFDKGGDELVKIEAEGKYFGPLFLRMFCINEPDLIFIGSNDFTLFVQVILERQCIISRDYLEGKVKLPSKETMTEDLNKEIKECFIEKNVPLQKYWKLFPNVQDVAYLKKMAEFGNYRLNQEHIDKLIPLGDLILKHVVNGNWIQYRNDPLLRTMYPDFEGDHSYIEENGNRTELF